MCRIERHASSRAPVPQILKPSATQLSTAASATAASSPPEDSRPRATAAQTGAMPAEPNSGAPGQAEQGQRRRKRQPVPPRPLHPLRKLEAPSGFGMVPKIHPNLAEKALSCANPEELGEANMRMFGLPFVCSTHGLPEHAPRTTGALPQKVRKAVIPFTPLPLSPPFGSVRSTNLQIKAER